MVRAARTAPTCARQRGRPRAARRAPPGAGPTAAAPRARRRHARAPGPSSWLSNYHPITTPLPPHYHTIDIPFRLTTIPLATHYYPITTLLPSHYHPISHFHSRRSAVPPSIHRLPLQEESGATEPDSNLPGVRVVGQGRQALHSRANTRRPRQGRA